MRRHAIAFVAALCLAVAVEGAVLAVTTTKTGKAVTAVKTVTNNEFAEVATSPNFADIPGMTTSISVPAGEKALLVITFSSEVNCKKIFGSDHEYCLVRVVVDGTTSSPGEVVFDSSEDGSTTSINLEPYSWETNAMQFVAGPLNSGSHTVKVQWRRDAGTGFYIGKRTLTVLRSKV